MNKAKKIITIILFTLLLAISIKSFATEVEIKDSNTDNSSTTNSPITIEPSKRENILNETFSIGNLTEIDLHTLMREESLVCSQKGGFLPDESKYSFTMGGREFYVGKNPTGSITAGVPLSVKGQQATTYTAGNYKEVSTIKTKDSSDYADIAYIATFYKENVTTGWSGDMIPDVQYAIWSTDINSGTEQTISTDLAKEANEYKKYVKAYEKFLQDNNNSPLNYNIKDKTVSVEVKDKIIWLGPYEVDYVRGFAKVGKREKVDFGSITEATLFSQDGKVLKNEAWEIVTEDEREGKKRSSLGEGDEDYKYPYPNEPFFIKVYADKLTSAEEKAITALSKISFSYNKLDVEAEFAMLEGQCYQIKWTGKVERKYCTKGYKQPVIGSTGTTFRSIYCEHGYDRAHTYEANPYIEMSKQKVSYSTQKMLKIKKVEKTKTDTPVSIPPTIPHRLYLPTYWNAWPYWPDYPDYPDRPDGDLTFTIAGFVWEDEKTGKESDYDGQIGASNSEEPESGIKNVEVKLYRHGTTEAIKSTYTDANGAYVFNEIPIGTYDVGFIYDGMTYTTTKAFASGSADDFKSNPNDEKYILNSKAEELPAERQAFNDKFYEISAEGSENAYGIHEVDASQDAISYETTNGISKLQTTYEDGKVKEPFKLEVKTSNTVGVTYPLTTYVNNSTSSKVINGQTYQANYKYMAYVNLGLQKRPEVDFALTKDVYTSTVTINSKQINYKYNARNADSFDIELKNSLSYSDIKYNREIYKSDYNYKIDDYRTNTLNPVNGTEIRGLKEQDQELKVFVTYKIKVRNQSEIYSGTINELVDYFDKNYVLISSDLKLDIRNDDGTLVKDKLVARAPYYETASGKTGSLSVTTPEGTSSNNYMKTYISGIENEILQTGDDIYLYITFEVDKDDATRNVRLGEKNNQVEITKYSTFDVAAITKTNTVGMIDRDSAPGNLDPENSLSLEDDSDIAPTINIKLYEGVTRTINGIIWEDQRDAKDLKNGKYSTGDGLRQETETSVNGVVVQLIEKITAADGSQYEYIWQEMYSGEDGYKYVDLNGTILDGKIGQVAAGTVEVEKGQYKFSGYIPGDYIVRFKYGDTQKTILPSKNTTSYNGQDYKSTVYLKGEDVNREWYDLGNAYLNNTPMSDAKDNEARRLAVINYSKTMKYDIAEVLASHETGETSLYDELIANTWMYADTAKIRAEIEYNTTNTDAGNNMSYNIRDIDFGLVERPKASIDLTKEIVGIKITLADGSTLIDTEAGLKRNVNWVDNRVVNGQPLKGAVHIYMDEEVMQGANIQIKYKIIVTNNSEVDYTGVSSNSVGSAYYTGVKSGNDKVVTTSVDWVADYVDSALVYREDDNAGRAWVSMEKTSLESIAKMEENGYLDPDVKLASKDIQQIIVNESLNSQELQPQGDSRTIELTLSKTLSTSEDADDPAFDNIAEILQYTNSVGRRADIPGNQDPAEAPLEGDADWTETVTITPPTGENRAHYFVITGAVLAILAGGVVVIKRKVLNK